MIKSVEETRRELFYKWFDEQQSIAERCGISLGQPEFDLMESAFNAALGLVSIKLPKAYINEYPYKVKVMDSVHSLNLGLKIK